MVRYGIAGALGALVVASAVFFLYGTKSIEVSPKEPRALEQIQEQADALSASVKKQIVPDVSLCPNPTRRPVAVMLAGDQVARPLSGIGNADIVVEMPVITGSITRLMAVFGCFDATEIGSIRSARDDFIPLAKSFDAIYAHWGGSHFALDQLKTGIIDNIDALKNPYRAFWRKKGIRAPHNGFSSTKNLYQAATKLGYRVERQFEDYLRSNQLPEAPMQDGALVPFPSASTVRVGYGGVYRVEWRYNAARAAYERRRGNTPEIDATTKQQVAAANVIVLKSSSRQIEGQYNDVVVFGEGEAIVFRNGVAIQGMWHKSSDTMGSRLQFLDAQGREVALAPGTLWIEIVEQTTTVAY